MSLITDRIKNSYRTNRRTIHSFNSKKQFAISYYSSIYHEYHENLGHYMRLIYNIFKYIDESGIPNKQKYIDIFEAQFSTQELLIIMLNSQMPNTDSSFKKYLDEYMFLKNIRTLGDWFEEVLILEFPKTKFNYLGTLPES